MAKKRTPTQRRRMSAAQKARYRREKKQVEATANGIIRTVEAIIHAQRLVEATNGNTKLATKIVQTIGSIS
jgi:hypothetical protein